MDQHGNLTLLRIGTWNVDYARPSKLTALRARMAEHPADIWVLTETNDELHPEGCQYCYSSVPRPMEEAIGSVRRGSRWVTIWSRFPALDLSWFHPKDALRTVAVRLDLSSAGRGAEMIVYGTVLPESGELHHRRAIDEQSDEWRTLMAHYPNAAFCLAGDFNTDMGAAPEYGLPKFYGPKRSTAHLQGRLHEAGMSCVTGQGIPAGKRPRFPPIDHIALTQRQVDGARVASVWAGSDGQGKAVGDRIGIVVEVKHTADGQSQNLAVGSPRVPDD